MKALTGVLTILVLLSLNAASAFMSRTKWSLEADRDRRASQCSFSGPVSPYMPIWKSLPIKMGIDSSVPKEARSAIHRAAQRWSTVLGQQAFAFHDTTDFKPGDEGQSVIFWNAGQVARPGDEQAVTSLFWYGDELTGATIKVNVKNQALSFEDHVGPQVVDLESLMIHEFGHALGLTHIENGGIMNSHLAPGFERRSMDSASVGQAQCLYAHVTNQLQRRSIASMNAKAH
jgi:hypothetical protein